MSSVIYLAHVPHGFYEEQMRGFFSQFGPVKRLRLSRSRKTGRSRGYAYIEFASPEVAAIVAETMNGYHLVDRYLKSEQLAEAKVHPKLFAGPRPGKVRPGRHLEMKALHKPRTTEEQAKRADRLIERERARKQKLADMGIELGYEVGYEAALAAQSAAAAKPGKKRSRAAIDPKPAAEPAQAEEEVEEAAAAAAAAAVTPARSASKKQRKEARAATEPRRAAGSAGKGGRPRSAGKRRQSRG